MAVVQTVAVAVVMVLVWADTVLKMLVVELVIDVRVDVVTVVAIALEFAVTAPHSIDAANDVTIDALTHGIGVDVEAGVNVDSFAVLMTVLDFSISTS